MRTVTSGEEQNYWTAYYVGLDMGVSEKVMLAGFEAGFAESNFKNLNHGDLDSLGTLQQRASWGSADERRNVEVAFRKFYERAKNVDNVNPNDPAHVIAQKVQRSHCVQNAPDNNDCKGRWGGNYLDEEKRAGETVARLRKEAQYLHTTDR